MTRLLTLRVLMRTINIITSHNNNRKFKALLIRIHQHFRSSLTRGVRIRRRQNTRLRKIIIPMRNLSIDLIRRNMNKPLDAHCFRTLKKDVRAIYISLGEAV